MTSGMTARLLRIFTAALAASTPAPASMTPAPWPATDGPGRSLPLAAETGPPRPDRTVAMFYFLWLGLHAKPGSPWDISRILAEDPAAMQKPDSPLWGPLHAAHHWGESIFGYYNTADPYVLRRHAQLLSDAGVDTVVFDVTNQLTYREQYRALLETWSAVRREGGRAPQVAFLCPFWQPAKVVRELWNDLYAPGLFREFWFEWDGRPLILADPDRLNPDAVSADLRGDPTPLRPGRTLGQSFTVDGEWSSVAARIPTWQTTGSAVTLTLRRDGPDGPVVFSRRATGIADNDWVHLTPPSPQPPGTYLLELSEPDGRAGWWSDSGRAVAGGSAFSDGGIVRGGRSLRVITADPVVDEIRRFFTFRTPQPDYFAGPAKPGMWSWLEVHPQHVFPGPDGRPEQMSVGVAQNAVNGRLGSMSESAGALGRSWHRGSPDTRPGAVHLGLNFAEQFDRALTEDPRVLFITGWNEWIAGRHAEFNGIREPVMFVDQFNQEFSRDIEPMKSGHGDSYYYQLVSYIRKYKGTPALPEPVPDVPISLSAGFAQWRDVPSSFPDDPGDTAHRDFPGYGGGMHYRNTSGRNDIVEAKAAHSGGTVCFYVRTRAPLTPPDEPGWMWLLLDADGNPATGWNGYDLIVNRRPPQNGLATVERATGSGWQWEPVGTAPIHFEGSELHLALPADLAGPATGGHIDFKWADNVPENGDIVSWLDAGDCAPNGRFNYRLMRRSPAP